MGNAHGGDDGDGDGGGEAACDADGDYGGATTLKHHHGKTVRR